jgi:hypothetical protein
LKFIFKIPLTCTTLTQDEYQYTPWHTVSLQVLTVGVQPKTAIVQVDCICCNPQQSIPHYAAQTLGIADSGVPIRIL